MKTRALFFLLIFFISVRSSAQDSLAESRQGIFVGLGVGTWFPDNKNKVLGHPLMLDVRFDHWPNKNSFSFNFDLVGIGLNKTTETIKVKLNDSVVENNEFFAFQVTFDYGRILYSKDRFSFEVNCGLGWGHASYYNPSAEIDIGKSSFIVNPGLAFGLFTGTRDLLQLKVQYYFADYALHDNVSTDFRGNYLELKLMWTGMFSSW